VKERERVVCLAIPGQIIELAGGGHFATVEVSKVRRTINVDLLEGEPLAEGDWVLIHVGFAMSRISAEHAAEQLRLLAMLGEDAQAMQELDGYHFGDEPRSEISQKLSTTEDTEDAEEKSQ
jgi:hydrogenase expression/formation protein HypC